MDQIRKATIGAHPVKMPPAGAESRAWRLEPPAFRGKRAKACQVLDGEPADSTSLRLEASSHEVFVGLSG